MTETEHYDFTTRELSDRLHGPHPEQWTDVIGALAERTQATVAEARSLDAIAIVRNLAHTAAAAGAITATVIDADELDGEKVGHWAEIREHLDRAASGLGWIAEGWI